MITRLKIVEKTISTTMTISIAVSNSSSFSIAKLVEVPSSKQCKCSWTFYDACTNNIKLSFIFACKTMKTICLFMKQKTFRERNWHVFLFFVFYLSDLSVIFLFLNLQVRQHKTERHQLQINRIKNHTISFVLVFVLLQHEKQFKSQCDKS